MLSISNSFPLDNKSQKNRDRFSGHYSFVFVFILICLAFTTGHTTVNAQNAKSNLSVNSGGLSNDAPPVIVTAPTVFHPVNTTFVVPISVSDITADNIVSFQFNVNYDPSVMNPFGANFGCSTAGTIASGFNVTCNVVTPGTLLLTANTGGVFIPTGSGPIVNLTFQAVPAAPGGSVSPVNFVPGSMFFFNNLGLFASTPVNGQVTLVAPTSAGVTVSGQVVDQNGRGLRNILVSIEREGFKEVVRTGSTGFFELSNVPAGNSYVVNASGRGLRSEPRLLTITDEVADLSIIALPGN